MELNIEAVKTSFLQVVLGLIRIVLTLRQFIRSRPIEIGRADGIVVAEFAVISGNHFQPLLAIHDVLHRRPNIIVIKRRDVSQHRQGDLFVAFCGINVDSALAFQKISSLRRYVIHRIQLARTKRILTCRRVRDLKRFDFVKEAAIGLPVIRVCFGQCAHTWLMLHQ